MEMSRDKLLCPNMRCFNVFPQVSSVSAGARQQLRGATLADLRLTLKAFSKVA